MTKTKNELRERINDIINNDWSSYSDEEQNEKLDQVLALFKEERKDLIDKIADNIELYFYEWRKEIDKAYKYRKPAVLLSFPIWLKTKLRSRQWLKINELFEV